MNDRFRPKSVESASTAAPSEPSPLLIDKADQELFINPNEINAELLNQPLLFRKWVKLKAQVNKKMRAIKQVLENTEAKIHLSYSQEGGRVKDVESKVTTHPDVVKLKLELIEAEELSEEYEGIARAFYQRHEALKEICANMRKEMME